MIFLIVRCLICQNDTIIIDPVSLMIMTSYLKDITHGNRSQSNAYLSDYGFQNLCDITHVTYVEFYTKFWSHTLKIKHFAMCSKLEWWLPKFWWAGSMVNQKVSIRPRYMVPVITLCYLQPPQFLSRGLPSIVLSWGVLSLDSAVLC